MTVLAMLVMFFCMEGITWFTHKYIMHGFLWVLHEDHHQPTNSIFQKNDLFFVIFAVPSMLMIINGLVKNIPWLTGFGYGVALYGFAYFVVHDIIIHHRFKLFKNLNNWYVKAIRRGHQSHHKHLNKEHGECFGMLWVPIQYFKETLKK